MGGGELQIVYRRGTVLPPAVMPQVTLRVLCYFSWLRHSVELKRRNDGNEVTVVANHFRPLLSVRRRQVLGHLFVLTRTITVTAPWTYIDAEDVVSSSVIYFQTIVGECP